MIPVKAHAIIVVGVVAEGVEVAPGVTVTVSIDGRPSAQVAFEVPSEAALRIRRRRAFATAAQFSIVDGHDVPVVAVEVTEGDVSLSGVGAEVNFVVIPVAQSVALAFA